MTDEEKKAEKTTQEYNAKQAEYGKEYRAKNKDKAALYSKQYRIDNAEHIAANKASYYEAKKPPKKEIEGFSEEEKREKGKQSRKNYNEKNRERIRERDAAKYKALDYESKEHKKQVQLDRIAKFDAERVEQEKEKASKRKAKHRAIPENREKEKADRIEYRKKNGEAMAAREKEYKTGRGRPSAWKKQGIILTVERYDEMLSEQNGCCKICGKFRLPDERVLVVDHNHETGKIRGLLCHPCNMGIGQLKDSIDVLRKAILYLEEDDG